MAFVAEKSFTDGGNNTYYMNVSDAYYCDANEEYKTTLMQSVTTFECPRYWGGTKRVSYSLSAHPYNGRCAMYLDKRTDQLSFVTQYNNSVAVDTVTQLYDENGNPIGDPTYDGYSAWLGFAHAYSEVNNMQFSLILTTNIPIFDTDTDASDYLFASTQNDALLALKKAINYKDSTIEPESGDVYVNNYGVLQKWTVDGKEEVQSTGLIYRMFKMKVTRGSLAFYKIEGIDNGMLKAGIKYSSDFNALSIGYSENGGLTWTYVTELPYNFIFRTRENELGEFYACPVDVTANDTNIPLWENETDADDYIAGNKDITDALNWSTISNKHPIANGTGDGDDETEFGEVFAKNYFSQQYIMSGSAVQEVATALFDTDATGTTHMWDKIKEGLGMYGNDPMQSVQGLMYFPVSLSEVFTNYQTQQYVYFGGYKLDLQSGCKKIVFPNGHKTIGHITIKRTFKNWRDYSPYSKCYVFFPYVGTYEIDLARYYDKDTEVRYYIDTRTGGCCACLIADGILTDYFNGQMGVQMPITLTDKSAYANSQIQTLLGGIKKEGDVITGGITTGQATGSWYGSAIQWSAGTMLNASFTTHDLTDNNINNYNKTKGGSSSMLNEYLPQYVTFMFEIQQDDPTDNHDRLLGLPSNASGNVGDFSGYLQVESVNLVCGIATPNEKKEILNALFNGIII